MEYEARITQEAEIPNLFVLTINGSKKNNDNPLWSRVRNFRRTDSIEEVRTYQTIEDLRNDISRERGWRIREKVAGLATIGVGIVNAIIFIGTIPVPISVVTACGLSYIGLTMMGNADEGLAKFNRAFRAFEKTPFRVGGPTVEESQTIDQNRQIPAQT